MPVAAALRAEPELRGRPLAIVESKHERTTIVAGHLRGLSVAQAQTVEPELSVRTLSLEGMRSTQETLLDVALSVTPRVQDADAGTAYLDLDGTEALFPTRGGLVTALETRLASAGLDAVAIGVAPTCTAALLAARHRGGGHIVEPDALECFLAPLPIDLLDPSEQLLERLTRWGVHTLGELCRIPLRSLGARTDEEGVRLARRARGEDLRPFEPSPPRLRFEEGSQLDHAIQNLEALSFALHGLLERLARRLRLRGLAVRELLLEFVLESGSTFARRIGTSAPTAEASVLTSLVRLALERDHPTEPVERMRVIATPGSVENLQLDLFLPPRPAPAELAVTLARLEALCGTGRVGAPDVPDTHRPDTARVADFDGDGDAYGPPPALPQPSLALRALRPPRPVRVWGLEGTPERVEALGGDIPIGLVVQCAGPWRLYGEWWGQEPFARDYFDVELSDGGLYRLYRNLETQSWYVDGMYD
jgi:protein ImuB